jgi:hypothetical protein
MSINFDEPVDEELIAKLKAMIPVVANDRKTFLLDAMNVIDGRDMKEIANAAKQPVKVEIHGQGEIKTLEDGTRYEVTPRGWRRLP